MGGRETLKDYFRKKSHENQQGISGAVVHGVKVVVILAWSLGATSVELSAGLGVVH